MLPIASTARSFINQTDGDLDRAAGSSRSLNNFGEEYPDSRDRRVAAGIDRVSLAASS